MQKPFSPEKIYLTEDELATLLNVSIAKLRKDRQLKRGLPYTKIGRVVRYHRGRCEGVLEDATIDGEG